MMDLIRDAQIIKRTPDGLPTHVEERHFDSVDRRCCGCGRVCATTKRNVGGEGKSSGLIVKANLRDMKSKW